MYRQREDTSPWYRQFWPWVLITLPGSAVLASLVTIVIAVEEQDGLVVGDYYKEGLAINRVLARDEAARHLGLHASLALDAANGSVQVELDSAADKMAHDTPVLKLLHPTRANRDVTAELTPLGGGRYRAIVGALAPGYWHLQLEDGDGQWRLTGRIHVPGQGHTVLEPATS